jgi:pyruvate/2-oxoglutarate dehydrogenase complex dihydrolipoamide dehydrogenase (E3) component
MTMFCRLRPWCLLLLVAAWTETVGSLPQQQQQPKHQQQQRAVKSKEYDYEMIILGAGAAGLFASGAASSLLGQKTALIELVPVLPSSSSTSTSMSSGGHLNVGGDCSNAACVPSKAVRSMARQAAAWKRTTAHQDMDWVRESQQHAADTVNAVRNRESPESIGQGNPNLDLLFVTDCRFIDAHSVQVTFQQAPTTTTDTDTSSSSSINKHNTTTITGTDMTTAVLTSRKFLITTGASPIVPDAWTKAAAAANNLPLYTYRSILRPDDNTFWDWLRIPSLDPSAINNISSNTTMERSSSVPKKKRLLIVGGGATACELGQSIARLAATASPSITTTTDVTTTDGGLIDIELVAPSILPQEDVTLQQSAVKLLVRAGIKCRLGERVQDILPDRSIRLSDGRVLPPFDAVLVCIGRSPGANLESLHLDQAGVAWDADKGVLVTSSSLQSITARNVYAAGDCSSAVTDRSRTASHAAWSGFHAVRNTVVPWILRVGSRSVHPTVPRVIYTDPELACVGLTKSECIARYGSDGFNSLYVPEEGSDRADMERRERDTDATFVELRATKSGRILGCTACGPAAAELANSMGMAVTNRLSVRDVAQSIHSYPSHGYLLHRIALSMALSNVRGLLSTCGPVGEAVGDLGGIVGSTTGLVRSVFRLPMQRRKLKKRREWEAVGASKALYLLPDASTDGAATTIPEGDQYMHMISFLDVFYNATLRDAVEASAGRNVSNIILMPEKQTASCLEWLQVEP